MSADDPRAPQETEVAPGWTTVRTVGTETEATLIVGFLENAGIPAEIESLLFHQEPVTFGRLAEVRVRVPREHQEAARRLLEELELTGEGEPTGEPGAV